MRWSPEASTRLIEWRRQKMCSLLVDASAEAREGARHAHDAAELRHSIQELAASLPEGKPDLTRATLLEWLRALGGVRAHVLEARQHAALLDDAAIACARLEERLRLDAASHQRKIRRIEQMRGRMQSRRDRRLERISERIAQEEFSCRPR